MATRHYTGGDRELPQGWTCTCGATHTSPAEEGCPACGAGRVAPAPPEDREALRVAAGTSAVDPNAPVGESPRPQPTSTAPLAGAELHVVPPSTDPSPRQTELTGIRSVLGQLEQALETLSGRLDLIEASPEIAAKPVASPIEPLELFVVLPDDARAPGACHHIPINPLLARTLIAALTSYANELATPDHPDGTPSSSTLSPEACLDAATALSMGHDPDTLDNTESHDPRTPDLDHDDIPF